MVIKHNKKHDFDLEDYIKTNKALSRLEELEQNGGRWVAKDRPHKNKKKYNRKRDRRINFDCPFCYLYILSFTPLLLYK